MDSSLREALRTRAAGRCEYCQLPERFATLRFQQDHVVARKHLGEATPANLAWACAHCNSYKGTDLAGLDPKAGKLTRLFNPRLDKWGEHFEWHGAVLVGKSAIGRTTVVLLRINSDERLSVRRELMTAGLFLSDK